MFDFVIDSLVDFWACKGCVGKWIVGRLFTAAMWVCILVAAFGFKEGWHILGAIGVAGAVGFFILDCKFYYKKDDKL